MTTKSPSMMDQSSETGTDLLISIATSFMSIMISTIIWLVMVIYLSHKHIGGAETQEKLEHIAKYSIIVMTIIVLAIGVLILSIRHNSDGLFIGSLFTSGLLLIDNGILLIIIAVRIWQHFGGLRSIGLFVLSGIISTLVTVFRAMATGTSPKPN